MREVTIKGKIFTFNLVIIVALLLLVTITFNITINLYFEKQIQDQLTMDANETMQVLLSIENIERPVYPSEDEVRSNEELNSETNSKPLPKNQQLQNNSAAPGNRGPVQMINSQFLFLDKDLNIVSSPIEEISPDEDEALYFDEGTIGEIIESGVNDNESVDFKLDDINYTGLVLEVPDDRGLLSYIIIYSSIDDIYQLQKIVNYILLAIFIGFSLFAVIFASYVSKRISTPLTSLCSHIKSISERDFDKRIEMEVDEELKGLVEHINMMAEKLEVYDEAQKNFLQNASHEFRTPLMSIQSYAEGIKYKVIEDEIATDVILDETKRLALLVEDLLYLSRLDCVEETYNFAKVNLTEVMDDCIKRMELLAQKKGLEIVLEIPEEELMLTGDGEALSRAFTNVLSNSIRYGKKSILIQVSELHEGSYEINFINDGPRFEEIEITHLFDRFYKGKKGNHGLGLAIVKNIVTKHEGEIEGVNLDQGVMFRIVLPGEIRL